MPATRRVVFVRQLLAQAPAGPLFATRGGMVGGGGGLEIYALHPNSNFYAYNSTEILYLE